MATSTIKRMVTNDELNIHYVQIAAQSASTFEDSVKACLNQYPYYSYLKVGDSVALACGWYGVRTYTINFTKEDTNKYTGVVYDTVNYTYAFSFYNNTNTLEMRRISTTFELLSADSLASFKSSLLSVANGMNYMDTKQISYYINGVIDGFEVGRNYCGTLSISYKDTERLYFDVTFSAYTGDIVVVGYDNGTWNINPINTRRIDTSTIFTPATGIAINESGVCYKAGKIANLSFSLKKSDNSTFSNTRTHLGTLATGWVPFSAIITPLSGNITINSYVDTIAGNLLIGVGGDVYLDKVNGISECRQVQVNCTYFTA